MRLRESIRLIETFLLMERMTPQEAVSIFKKHGVTVAGMSAADLKKAYRGLVVKLHPDKGGNDDDLKYVNAAYDVLKDGNVAADQARTSASRSDTVYANRPPKGDDIYKSRGNTPWYHDQRKVEAHLNKMAEETGGGKIYTTWNYDGMTIRGGITAKGNPKTFSEMAKLSIKWDRFNLPRAVLLSSEDDPHAVLLICADDVMLKQPIRLEHDSFNMNPGNDRHFTQTTLWHVLDGLRKEEQQ